MYTDEYLDRKIKHPKLFTFSNRLTLCVVSVLLLWITSLELVINLTTAFIVAPSFIGVYNKCNTAYTVTIAEKELYTTCANNQINTCHNNLQSAYYKESNTMNNMINFNAITVNKANLIQTNCTTYLTQTKSLLTQWINYGYTNTLTYQNCSTTDLTRTNSLLNSRVIGTSNQVHQDAQAYSKTSSTLVNRLSQHIIDMQNYQLQYNTINTATIKQSTSSAITQQSRYFLPKLNASFTRVQYTTNQLINCLTLANITPSQSNNYDTTCKYSYSARQLYMAQVASINQQSADIQTQYTLYKADLIKYQNDVTNAINNVNTFYNTIMGPKGILTVLLNIVSVFNVFGSEQALCAQTSPSWCSFSPSNWAIGNIAIPSQPQVITLAGMYFVSGILCMRLCCNICMQL